MRLINHDPESTTASAEKLSPSGNLNELRQRGKVPVHGVQRLHCQKEIASTLLQEGQDLLIEDPLEVGEVVVLKGETACTRASHPVVDAGVDERVIEDDVALLGERGEEGDVGFPARRAEQRGGRIEVLAKPEFKLEEQMGCRGTGGKKSRRELNAEREVMPHRLLSQPATHLINLPTIISI